MDRKGIILKWGLIGGVLSIIIGLIAYLLNMTDSKLVQYLSILIMLGAIVFAHFEYRDKLNNGFAKFGELFRVGFLVSLVISFISLIWFYLYVSFLDTDLIARTLSKVESDMVERGLSGEGLDQALNMTKKFMTPLYMSLTGFFYAAILGLVVTLVSALIIRNENPMPNTQTETED